MNDAAIYHQTNVVQKRDALLCLQEFGTKIQWKYSGESIIDIGCGDGSVTVGILKNIIPSNYKKIVGCDISEAMVKYSQENYSNDNIEFKVLNIEGLLPETFRNSFDHAFSFYALHWVKRQMNAFTNIYEMLKEGGGCWLMFLGQMVIYEVWRKLAQIYRWHHWLKDVEHYIGPYHDSNDPEKEIKQIMNKIGFTNVEVVTKPLDFVFENVQLFKDAMTAVNPFNIPKDMFNDYMDDMVHVLRAMNKANVNNMGLINEALPTHYTLLIVSGNK